MFYEKIYYENEPKVKDFGSSLYEGFQVILFLSSIYLLVLYFYVRIYSITYKVPTDSFIRIFYEPVGLWSTAIFFYYLLNCHKYQGSIQIRLIAILFFIMHLYLLVYYSFDFENITHAMLQFQEKIYYDALFGIFIGALFVLYSKNSFFKLITFLGWLVITYIILSRIDYELLRLAGSHLLFGDIYVLITLCLFLSFNIEKNYKLIIFTTLLAIEYMIGSRASFYAFAVVYFIYILREFNWKVIMSLLFLSIIGWLLIFDDAGQIKQRMFGVFMGKTDFSLNERTEQFKCGFNSLKNNWFLGDYLGHVLCDYRESHLGKYMHNWLSYWRQFGLVFFIIITYVYLYALYYFFKSWIKGISNVESIIFYIGLFEFVQLLIFRGYNNLWVWFALGMMYTYIEIDKNKNLRKVR